MSIEEEFKSCLYLSLSFCLFFTRY